MTSLFGESVIEKDAGIVSSELSAKKDLSISKRSAQKTPKESYTFEDLGLNQWVCSSCKAMGFKQPTPIQQACIPAILEGRNVMGCAETGSGKTAAFALPMLQDLSEDPYGIFGIILTPTRELAVQIEEQIVALGSPVGVRTCLIIGGLGIIDQGVALSRMPHIVIATPGRLRHHLESASPPQIARTRYLVLDEADRLLSVGFESELGVILSHLTYPRRQTLLFSATLTSSLEQLERIASPDTLRFDLTSQQVIPSTLTQQYIFVPSQVKLCYLVGIIRNIVALEEQRRRDVNSDDDTPQGSGRALKKKKEKARRKKQSDQDSERTGNRQPSISIIIFASSCKRCQMVAEVLLQLHIDCVALHSLLSQNRRAAALGKFKNQATKVLVATDIASRGLDIPQVNLVINLDVPKSAEDYVHRVGRTARAGRAGRSVCIICPQEVELIHTIEEFTKQKMGLSEEIGNDDVLPLLNPIAKAMKFAELRMMEVGFEDQVELARKRKRKQQRQELRKIVKNSKEEDHSR